MKRKRIHKKTTVTNEETAVLPMKEIVGYRIASPHCGRDKKGNFRCVCGKCKPILFEKSNNGNNCCNNT